MKNDKSGFNNKFANYLNNILDKEKKERLFGREVPRNCPENRESSSVFPFSNNRSSYGDRVTSISRRPSEVSQKLESEAEIEPTPVKRRRLKKLKQLEQNQCAICLDQIKKRCQLKCKHIFCFECVESWFETSNKCPYCREEVRSFWFKGEEFIVEPKRPDFDQDSFYDEEEVSQMDFPCYNCDDTQVGDTVLICDRCEVHACHVECDPTLNGRMPRGDWICHFCR